VFNVLYWLAVWLYYYSKGIFLSFTGQPLVPLDQVTRFGTTIYSVNSFLVSL
jgi:hypothetical protein